MCLNILTALICSSCHTILKVLNYKNILLLRKQLWKYFSSSTCQENQISVDEASLKLRQPFLIVIQCTGSNKCYSLKLTHFIKYILNKSPTAATNENIFSSLLLHIAALCYVQRFLFGQSARDRGAHTLFLFSIRMPQLTWSGE